MVAPTMQDTAQTQTRDSRALWHAQNDDIKKRSNSENAKRLEKWVLTGSGLTHEPDETEIFIALQTCAYRATKSTGGRRLTAAVRAQWEERWFRIRDFIVEKNLPLVYSMKAKFESRHLDQDELLSEAMYGLIQAAGRFDPWRGFRFSTYACHAILRSMMRCSKRASNYRRLFPVQHDASYEKPTPDDPDSGLYVERLKRALHHNLGDLTEIESEILDRRFPTDDGKRLTLREIGDAVGLSKERVRQLQNSALEKLRDVLQCDPVLQ